MKKVVFFGLLAMALAFGFIGCGGDDGPRVIGTYGGTADGESIVLKIMDDGTFVLTIGDKISKGTATQDDDSWILTPSESDEPFFN